MPQWNLEKKVLVLTETTNTGPANRTVSSLLAENSSTFLREIQYYISQTPPCQCFQADLLLTL